MPGKPTPAYTIRPSWRKFKKYAATLRDGRVVHFGDSRYGQYRDKTRSGTYAAMDHGDDTRKKNYYARHGKKAGKHTAKWFAHKYLW